MTRKTIRRNSPTQKTLAWCRERNYPARVVERWNPFAKRRVDLFGFIDLIYVTGEPSSGVTGVQCCMTDSLSARREKIFELHAQPDLGKMIVSWLTAGNRIEIHGWAKRGERGKRKLWTLKREVLTLDENGRLYFHESN